jgi:hypothetical protein
MDAYPILNIIFFLVEACENPELPDAAFSGDRQGFFMISQIREKKAATSSAHSAGCSMAAKCPPLGGSL